MSKCDVVKQLFEQNHLELEQYYNTRQHFYIANDLLRLVEQCDQPSALDDDIFAGPLYAALYHFLNADRLDDAERVLNAGLKNKTLEEIVYQLCVLFQRGDNDIDLLKFRVFLDRLLSFFAQIGEEETVLNLGRIFRKKIGGEALASFLPISWPQLLHSFVTGSTGKRCLHICQDMYYFSKKFDAGKIDREILKQKSDDTVSLKNKIIIDLRAWALKRQMLGIYSGIGHYLKTLDKPDASLEKIIFGYIVQLCRDIVENYVSIINYTVRGYLLNTLGALEGSVRNKDAAMWRGDVVKNLENQLELLDERYAEITGFFEKTAGFHLRAAKAGSLKGEFKSGRYKDFKDKTVTEQIDVLKKLAADFGGIAEPDVLCRSRGADERLTLSLMKDKIANCVEGVEDENFKRICREWFTKPRLNVLAVSLDNSYSTGSAFFFRSPATKTLKGQKIETELCIMKKWGSTGGMFQRERYINSSYGGGFFLFHNGFGLAIDPGPDFLKLLVQHSDYDLMDIDGAICTHPHRDHSAEFARVLIGIREYNRSAGFKRFYYALPHEEDGDFIYPSQFREDFAVKLEPETCSAVTPGSGRGHGGIYYFPDENWNKTDGIRIETILVDHKIYSGRKESAALLVSPLKNGRPLVNILFSGDAIYEPGLFESIPMDYKPDFLVLNIASTLINDIAALKPHGHLQPGDPLPQDNHLGYAGVQSILNRLRGQYKVAVLNEFYEVQSRVDGRRFIADALEHDVVDKSGSKGHPPKIFCVEPGTRFRFREQPDENSCNIEVYCSSLCSASEKGFVPVPGSNAEQIRPKMFCRRAPVMILCDNCGADKKSLFCG